jgi:hypothetical protein
MGVLILSMHSEDGGKGDARRLPANARSFSSSPRATATSEVADLLSISVATVETHRAHILQKLDVHSTAELVLYAVRRGIIS